MQDKNYIQILQSIQKEYGYLPEDVVRDTARKFNVPFVKLWGVATFYTQFKLSKRGKYIVQVCNGTACYINKSYDLIEFLKKRLNIGPGETTKDDLITLELVNCIGACARSPAVMINNQVYGNQSPETLKKIIDQLK